MKKELEEINLLIGERPVLFETRVFGFKKKWRMSKMTLYKLLLFAKNSLKIDVSEKDFDEQTLQDQMAKQYELIRNNAKIAAAAVSIIIDTKAPRWWLRRHLMRHIDSGELRAVTERTLKEANLENFFMSILLMNGSRISKPKRIDKSE